ncbi:MAG: FtsX-like permease family protein [Parcubacteria group bacterium]
MKLNFFLRKKDVSLESEEDYEKKHHKASNRPKETWKEKHTGISFSMISYISWKNLKVGRARSILTIGGVALGIGIITFLLSIGFGMQQMIVSEVTKDNPIDVIDINNGNLDNFVSLNEDVVGKIKNIDGVKKIERRVNTGGKIILGESQTDVIIYGATVEYLDMLRVKYQDNGGNFSNDGDSALISDRLANLLGFGNPYEAIGKKIVYNIALSKDVSSKLDTEKVTENNEITISGIVNKSDNTYIYLPSKMLEDKFGVDSAQEGKVVVSDMTKFDNVKQQLEQMGFVTSSIAELIAGINSFFSTVRIFLVIFGVIIMSISAMGMLNTLSVSLLQRTKEVGIMKALGTKRFDVFKMFILESIIISFVGGVLGFFGGYGLALFVNKLLIILGKRMGTDLGYFVYVPTGFILAIAGFVLFLGIITGVMPAFRASKIHALEALRYE